MEIQKIVNLLNGSDNDNSKFATNGTLLTVNQMAIIHKMMKQSS